MNSRGLSAAARSENHGRTKVSDPTLEGLTPGVGFSLLFPFDPFRVGPFGAIYPGWRGMVRHPGLFILVLSEDLPA